jgi:hypothetical protein
MTFHKRSIPAPPDSSADVHVEIGPHRHWRAHVHMIRLCRRTEHLS